MKDPTKTPEPVMHRKHVKELHPKCDLKMEQQAKDWGYNDYQSLIVGDSQELLKQRHQAVAFDTNKTRRKMVKPTEKGTYK